MNIYHNYQKMQPETHNVGENVKLQTNSIINIKTESKLNPLIYHWKRCPAKIDHPLLKKHHPSQSSHQYVCTPLDYNSTIQLTVSVPSSPPQFSHQRQHFVYGPISLQHQLIHRLQKHVFNPKYDCFMKKGSHRQPIKAAIAEGKVKILSTKNKLVLECKVIQQIQESKIMKIDNEGDSFMLDLRTGENSNFGEYIRLQFDDRLERDSLICQIMEANGINFKISNDKMHNKHKSNETTRIQSRTHFHQATSDPQSPPKNTKLLRINSLEKDIHEILNDEEPDEEQDSSSIIKDIYDILYTPEHSKSSLSPKRQRKEERKNQELQEDHELTKTIKNKDFLSLMTSCRSVAGNLHEKKDKHETKIEKQQMKKSSRKPRDTRISLADELSLEERLKKLTKSNISLIKDNKKLMEENRELKQQIAKDKQQIEKIKEMRTTIAHLVSRISYLEGFNQGNILMKSQNLKEGIKETNHKANPLVTNREKNFKFPSQIEPLKKATSIVFMNRETLEKKEAGKEFFHPFMHTKHETNPQKKFNGTNKEIKDFHSPTSGKKKNLPQFRRFYSPKNQIVQKK